MNYKKKQKRDRREVVMRRMRKLWAVLLAVCMVCNLYGMDVFAAGNEQSVANGNKNGYTVYTEERAQEPEDAGVAGEAAGNGNSETVEDTGKAEDSDSADGATDSTESEAEETDSGNTAEETEEDGSGNTAGDFGEGNSGNTGEEMRLIIQGILKMVIPQMKIIAMLSRGTGRETI